MATKRKPPAKLTRKQREQYEYLRTFIPRLSTHQFLNYWTAVRASREKARRINRKLERYVVPEISLPVADIETARDFYYKLRISQNTARKKDSELVAKNAEYEKISFIKNLEYVPGFSDEDITAIAEAIQDLSNNTWITFIYSEFNADITPLRLRYNKEYVEGANITAERIREGLQAAGINVILGA